MWTVEVIPIKRGLPKEVLTYFSAEPVADGVLVSVPIRSKLVDAIVVGSRDAREEKAAIKSGDFSLRKIAKIKTESPIPPYIFDAATLAARYYRRTRGDMLDMYVPDFSFYGSLPPASEKKSEHEAQPERLIFQAPLEDRISHYRTYIREAFAKKESLVFVVPTIADCDVLEKALARGVADFVLVINGELSKKKMADTLKRLASEPHAVVVITTPSYVSLLRPDISTIILEHESSGAYSTPTLPSYDLRVLVEILARSAGKKLILGDSLLRIETLGRYEEKEFTTLVPVTFRSLAPIDISVIPHGIPEELPARARNEQIPALSEPVRALLEKASVTKSKVFAFALRTGLATVTKCRDCFTVLLCEHCEAPLVLYTGAEERRVFICNKCKRHTPSEQKCTKCGSWNLSAFGLGTEFVEEEIKRLFPELPVFRIDREATPTRAEARKVAALFTASEFGVLVGTEMALFYVSDIVSHSVIVSFDTLFNIPSYRTNERIINLFLAIAERTRGKLYVQTKNPDEPIIALVQSNNYSAWYRAELAERSDYRYPPYSTIIKITWRGKEAERSAVRDYLEETLAPFGADMFDSIVITRGKRESATNAVIRPKREDWSLHALLGGKGLSEHLRETLAKLPEDAVISVNPENLL